MEEKAASDPEITYMFSSLIQVIFKVELFKVEEEVHMHF